MPTKNLLHLDLSEFSKKLQVIPVTQLKKLDGILSDLANHAHDTYEYILELEDKIKGLSCSEAEGMINHLTTLQAQVSPLMDTLCDIEYDSKYMDRVQHTLGTIEDEIPDLLAEVKKQIKN